MTSCLAEDTVLAFVEGRLADARVAEVDEHVDSCATCRQLVLAVARSERTQTPGDAQLDVALSPTLAYVDLEPPRARPVLAPGSHYGRYVVAELLGKGGSGAVYAALDPELDRRIAIKVLRHEGAGPQEARLVREGRAIARLAHPNVVTVFDVGTHESSVFVAMELVEGASLDRWLAEPRPWREVLDAFLQAGEGLRAAHAAGLVHRDFKPANVLIGRDGRVRVGDFGLARFVDSEPTTPPTARDANSPVDLTRTGSLLGTPAYMSPEQFEGKRIDERSDLFSFSVALFEGLYGKRPFAGTTPAALYEAIIAGAITTPSTADVPAWIRNVVLRGLAARPEDRYPSLAAMLAELRVDRGARRKRWLAGGGAVAALGTAAVLAVVLRDDANACAVGDEVLAGVWDPARKAEVAKAFRSAATVDAELTLMATTTKLDAYVEAWTALKQKTCAHQGEAEGALRTICLDDRRTELRALTSLFANADAVVVHNAITAVDKLTPLARCENVAALASRVPPPKDPITHARVLSLRARIEEVRAQERAGQWAEAYHRARALTDEAALIAYRPLQGEALLVAGRLADRLGDPKASESYLTRAVQAASAGSDDRTAAEAWIEQVGVVGLGLGRYDDALARVGHATAAIERMGGDELATAALDQTRAYNLVELGRYAEARQVMDGVLATRRRLSSEADVSISLALSSIIDIRLGKFDAAHTASLEVLALREKAFGPHHPEVGAALHDLAMAKYRLGDYAAAEHIFRRALEVTERALGPEHPRVAEVLSDFGLLLRTTARYAEAREVYARSIAIAERSADPTSVTSQLHNLGSVYVLEGKAAEAEATLQRALQILIAGKGAEHPEVATFYASLSQAYVLTERWDDGLEAIRKAIAIHEKTLGPTHVEVAFDHSNLGELYLEAGRIPEAAQAYAHAAALFEKLDEPRGHAIALTNLGLVELRRKRPAEAIPYLEKAIVLDEKLFGTNHSDLMFDLMPLGRALLEVGRRDASAHVYERALALDGAERFPDEVATAKAQLKKLGRR
jgi:tetratricopeptide (TPR) repeat protein